MGGGSSEIFVRRRKLQYLYLIHRTFYIDDLPCFMDSIEVEYDLWITKWKSVDQSLRPTNFIDVLISCDKVLYPNIRQVLKILAILPVSTASAERNFSTPRRLKTYLRNSTSENRLVGF
jgi:hypothetical protein